MKPESCYCIVALPALGELGSTPPLWPAQLLEHVADSPGPRALVEALFLFDDLLQREAFLAGEREKVSPVVLTPGQTRNENTLPAYLAPGTEDVPRALKADGLWDACFRHAEDVARRRGSAFLAGWVGHEVALRNALAVARARRLGLDESDYLVATDLAASDEDFTKVLSTWTAAPTPLAGLRVLIEARWAWLAEHDAWFTFRDDELAAYAARLMLLKQWLRLAEAKEGSSAAEKTNESPGTLERTAK